MALDNANFIAELSITDPLGTDPLSQGDDQIRTIKRATFQSFPNVAAQVSLTDAQLNLAAIKNEANVFTATQTVTDSHWQINNIGATAAGVRWQRDGLREWAIISDGTDLRLDRFDVLGAPLDIPWTVNYTTGVMDFLQVPTVAGAPLWIAGEIRQFVGAVTLGANWFLADGTNGTKNLADRWLVGSGAFSGVPGADLQAELTAQAQATVTGSTAITTAQMPVHNHNVRAITGNGGIGDVSVGFPSTETVMGGQRSTVGGTYLSTNSTGNKIVNDAGSGAGHTHPQVAMNVEASNPTFTNSVQPVSVAVETWQYVP